MKMRHLIFIGLLGLCGCAPRQMLTARSEYLNSTYLASTQIRTPEPCYPCFVGEQVIISWNLPRCIPLSESELHFLVRLGDREVEERCIPVQLHSGFWIYRIINKEYWAHKGILSYSARIVRDGEEVYRFDHKLWQDLIPDSQPSCQ